MQQIRAFIAVELPPPTREALAGVVGQLHGLVDDGVRWTRPDSLHLTLRFLGNIDIESVPAVSDWQGSAWRRRWSRRGSSWPI